MRSFFLTLLVALAFQSCSNYTDSNTQVSNETNENEAVAQAVKQTIAPAFADFNVKTQSLTVKGTHSQTLTLQSGSSINVPEAAFVDAEGNVVEGDVNIEFREFHNAAEIIASGIPMKVMAENGTEEWMQTAGMYEISGSQNGQPVFVAPGKSLEVNLVSDVDGAYDFWKFEEEDGNWGNLGVSTPVPNPNGLASEGESPARTNVGPAPAAPIAFDENSTPIDLDVNLKNFPELADKQNVVWQYAGKDSKKDPAQNPNLFQKEWDEIELVKNTSGSLYTLTLANDEEEISLPVVPALKGKDLEKALADYQVRLEEYKRKLASVAEVAKFQKKQMAFVRSFQIEGFGIYNYDILRKMEDVVPLLANFEFGTEIPLNIRKQISVYLIAEKGKMVVKFPPSDWKKFRIDPEADNSLVAVLPDNKLAILNAADLKKQMPQIKKAKGKDYVFQLKTQDEAVQSVEEMNERLVAL
ncbi:MAG: hypothetical protein AAFZ15_12505 [Bacteroidota bacterium]